MAPKRRANAANATNTANAANAQRAKAAKSLMNQWRALHEQLHRARNVATQMQLVRRIHDLDFEIRRAMRR